MADPDRARNGQSGPHGRLGGGTVVGGQGLQAGPRKESPTQTSTFERGGGSQSGPRKAATPGAPLGPTEGRETAGEAVSSFIQHPVVRVLSSVLSLALSPTPLGAAGLAVTLGDIARRQHMKTQPTLSGSRARTVQTGVQPAPLGAPRGQRDGGRLGVSSTGTVLGAMAA